MRYTSGWSSDLVLASLPESLCPADRHVFNTAQNDGVTWVDVLGDCTIRRIAGTTADDWLSLDGVAFAVSGATLQPISLSGDFEAYGRGYAAPYVVTSGGFVVAGGLAEEATDNPGS